MNKKLIITFYTTIFAITSFALLAIPLIISCSSSVQVSKVKLEKKLAEEQNKEKETMEKEMKENKQIIIIPDYKNSRYKEIYLAGGCFWGLQAYFDRMMGIEYTNVGYANGDSEKTDYYSIKKTGHAETVYVVYNPAKITLEELLGYYYEIIDPTSLNKQGNDVGTQYRTGIYYVNSEDKEVIENVTKNQQAKYNKKIVTEILPLKNYVLAEDYHQNYLDNNPGGYCHIDLSKVPREKPRVNINDYPKPSLDEIKKKLTPLQFSITQENATESAFNNEYWGNKEPGLYVDVVTGQPLFLSLNKYDSGTGWPSFTRPIQWDVVTYREDSSLGMKRIEVRSRSGDSHLGHLFYDGPKQETGLRYCINSGSLNFIPLDEMEKRGYVKFKVFFES